MRSILENVSAYDLKIKRGFNLQPSTQTLTGTFNMGADGPPLMLFDCGASGRIVVLPSILNGVDINGRSYVIVNVGAANTITLNAHADESSVLVGTIPPGDQITVFASSQKLAWYADAGTTGVQPPVVSTSFTASAGTATVAPYNFAAGTSLTTATVGAEEFDGKAYYLTSLASSRQVVDTEQFVCLTANGPTDNNSLLDAATAAAVFRTPTNGTITLGASTTYGFEAMYYLSNTGTTSHTWSALFAGTATFTSIAYLAMAYTGTTSGVTLTAMSAAQVAVATAVALTAASTSATEFCTFWLRGVMRINAAGTLIPQLKASARPGASGTPGVTILAGSYFRVWPLGSDTVASVGNWS